MDNFFSQEYCDRCGGSLKDGRIMSKYNTDCICMSCKEKETKRADYKTASDSEISEIRKGNYNYKGIGFNGKEE